VDPDRAASHSADCRADRTSSATADKRAESAAKPGSNQLPMLVQELLREGDLLAE
jgi:hypothetical protein